MKQVILNADDFGLTRGINDGVIRAHLDGILTSATLMATGPAFEDAVEKAKANPKLGVGCHLVLTGGISVAPPQEIPTLASPEGQLPETLASFVARVTSGRIRSSDIETEVRAQIDRIRRAGLEPTHVDTHKHTHVHPRVMRVVALVARDCGIARIRNPIESFRDSWDSTRTDGVGRIKDLAASTAVLSVASQFRAMAKRCNLRFPEHFLGLAATGRVTAAALGRLIDSLPEGTTEIMLHPGICDADLASTGSRLQHQRQVEMEALLSPEARRAVENRAVQLITYRELS